MNAIIDTANDAIDAAQAIARNPIIRMIGRIWPQANALIDLADKYAPVIDAAQPVIARAFEAGAPVFDAAVKAAPEFIDMAKEVISAFPKHIQLPKPVVTAIANGDTAAMIKLPIFENFARNIGGFDRMTPDEEKRWMDSMTPGNDPSQENSKYTVG